MMYIVNHKRADESSWCGSFFAQEESAEIYLQHCLNEGEQAELVRRLDPEDL